MGSIKGIFGLFALLLVVSLAGCSSEQVERYSSTGSASGIAVDPYIVGAKFQEIAADGVTVLQRESMPSDERGVFIFPKPLTQGSMIVMKVGSQGIHEGANYEGLLKRRIGAGAPGGVVSPLTTLLANGVDETELVEILASAGLNLNEEDLYKNPMEEIEQMGALIGDQHLTLLQANMAVNQFMVAQERFDIDKTDLDDYDQSRLFNAFVKANQDMLSVDEFSRIKEGLGNRVDNNSPLAPGDLIRSVVDTMRNVVEEVKQDRKNGTLDPGVINTRVQTASQVAVEKVVAFYLERVGNETPPQEIDGATVYATDCAGCHNIGSGGIMDLSGKGTAVIEKIGAGHKGKNLDAEHLQALVAYVNANVEPPAPEPNPDPTPDGQALYDTQCAGCHKLGAYDASGSATDLGGREALVTGKLNMGHMGTTLSTAEITALVDWVSLNPAVVDPTPEPTPEPNQPPNGIALYESECHTCHGPLESNNINDISAAGIEQAISANLGGMGMLILSAEEIQAIADSLPTPTPTPDPDPIPVPVSGQASYDGKCAGCHILGDYDTAGFAPEIGGAGNLVISMIEAGHKSISMSAEELNALADWADANPAPVVIPDPTPVPVNGQALYDGKCAGCHILGDYDTAGYAPELGGAGNLVITTIEAGHQSISMTAEELNALADWADANPAPVIVPDPTPVPVNGQTLYDNNCGGCHSVNAYDATGAPDLASTGDLIAPKLAAGHKGFVLTTEEEVALADFLNQYQAVATGPDYSDCTACHAQPPNGGSFPNTAGAHAVHTSLAGIGSDCSTCHSGTTHDDFVDVSFAEAFNAQSGSATMNSDGTCSTVSCHGGKTTPDWFNGSISVNTQCTSCHARTTSQYNGYISGEHGKHRNYSCTVCHNTAKLENGHFNSLSTSNFEQSPASTIGGGSTRVGSYSNGSCSSVGCHGSERW
ncbi:MAG TPA: CxxxxCH/CxxCH domain-containing protein [Geopsychrobacteraceae bacterium]|nr:CxxxxCH/CxxCH domain-containing protein [Geopsychrobacteraceae bacterium]